MRTHGEDTSNPITVLIGGWAVYSYNQWYGSVDIDLVTNSRTRHSLMWYLRNERKFVIRHDEMAPTTVEKTIPGGKIIIDFGSREDICKFVGRAEECPFSLIDGRTEAREIRAGFSVVVPEKTLLMIFKLKAAWDRYARLQNGSSNDAEWDNAKLRKDRADILSLIDPSVRGTEIDIQYLGEKLQEYHFLAETLLEIPDDNDAISMYNRMSRGDAIDSIETLLQLTIGRRK